MDKKYFSFWFQLTQKIDHVQNLSVGNKLDLQNL